MTQQQNDLLLNEKTLEGRIGKLVSDVNRVQAEYDKKEAEINADYTCQLDKKQKQIDAVVVQIKPLMRLIVPKVRFTNGLRTTSLIGSRTSVR